METLTPSLLFEKNKISSIFPWVILMEIETDSGTLYLCRNNEDIISADSTTYTAFPFDIEATKQVSKGQIPTLELTVSNVTRALQPYIEEATGLVGKNVTVKLVHVNTTTIDPGTGSYTVTEALSWIYTITATKITVASISFTLGAPNPLYKRFPLYRYLASHCNWVYQGLECNYTWTAQARQNSHKYNVGDLISHTSTITFRCCNSGISNSSSPTFPHIRHIKVNDGTAKFIENSKATTWLANYPYLKDDIYENTNGHIYRVTYGTDEVIGSDGKNYFCKLSLPAASATYATRPIIGTYWSTYFSQGGSNGVIWEDGITYTCRKSGATTPTTWTTTLFGTVTDNLITWTENYCKRNLENCKAIKMSERFGGYPGMSVGGVILGSY